MKQTVLLFSILVLAGCTGDMPELFRRPAAEPAPSATPADPGAPLNIVGLEDNGDADHAALVAPPPAEGAVTAEALDTTTPEQRAAAATPAPAPGGGEVKLGTTVASIGSPTEPGFWIRTPLVSAEATGRIVYPVTGRSVNVRLLPSGGAAGSGSQVSLPAMRLLDAPLTGLPELVVYRN